MKVLASWSLILLCLVFFKAHSHPAPHELPVFDLLILGWVFFSFIGGGIALLRWMIGGRRRS